MTINKMEQKDKLDLWNFNCSILYYKIMKWKIKFIINQKKKYPKITNKELIKKIKETKARRFRDDALLLLNTS